MIRWICIFLLALTLIPIQSREEKRDADNATVAICLRNLDIPSGTDLGYVVRGVNTTTLNRLAQFPDIVVYPGASALGEYFKDVAKILVMDKVQLLQIRRETGFDGLIFGSLEEKDNQLTLTIHLVDFSSGRVYFTGELQGAFGSEILNQLEQKIISYADTLLHYYNSVLAVTSEPAGAEVWVNDGKVGVTPIGKLDVNEGQNTVQVKKQGYIPFETRIELKTGQKALIHAQLHRYSLTATSEPSGASVFLDSKGVGVTPIKGLIVGQPNFRIKFAKEGFAPYTQTISLQPGERAYVHAELYDLLIDHLRNKESVWEVDSHNFSLVQTMHLQNLKEIEVEAFPLTHFRYYAKLGRWQIGANLARGTLKASQHFDTFLGIGEGYEPFTISLFKGTGFCQYNVVEQLNRLECYVGVHTGFAVTTADQTNAPADLNALRKVNPVLGGEIGANFYLFQSAKLSTVVGAYYAGDLEYAVKKASYWGQAVYESESLPLHPFYAGLSLTISIWPALMSGRK